MDDLEASHADFQRERQEDEMAAMEAALEYLWELLDEVDTVDDVAKGDAELFRLFVGLIKRKRFVLPFATDGSVDVDELKRSGFVRPASMKIEVERLRKTMDAGGDIMEGLRGRLQHTENVPGPGEIVATGGGVPTGVALTCDVCGSQTQAETLEAVTTKALEDGWVLQCTDTWPGVEGVENLCPGCKVQILATGADVHRTTGPAIQILPTGVTALQHAAAKLDQDKEGNTEFICCMCLAILTVSDGHDIPEVATSMGWALHVTEGKHYCQRCVTEHLGQGDK